MWDKESQTACLLGKKQQKKNPQNWNKPKRKKELMGDFVGTVK